MRATPVNTNTPAKVGTFFEDLAEHLLGAEKGESINSPGADLVHWKFDLMIEAKGGDNNHSFRISIRQLKNYLSRLGFPFSRTVYFLFGYKNRDPKGKRKTSLFRKTKGNEEKIRKFLAKNLSVLYVLDAEAVYAIGKRSGETHMFPASPGERNYGVSRSCLEEIFAGEEAFSKFGLGADFRIERAEIETAFEGCALRFPVKLLLHKETDNGLVDHLRANTVSPQKSFDF